jgi:uncharacterized protein (TIGR03118 family)
MLGLRPLRISLVTSTIAAGLLCAGSSHARADTFAQVDLVSDIPLLAEVTDPELVNPWGFSHSATSPFWISDQGANAATLYSVTNGTSVTKTNINPPFGFVGIPTTAAGPQGPTGQVNNSNASSFPVGGGGNGGSARFIFANLNGTISAWDTGLNAFIQPAATVSGAVFTGLAINQAQTMLYAANSAGAGGIAVFDGTFAPANPAMLSPNPFATPGSITALGLVPFNVQDINGSIYVTYALPGHSAEIMASGGKGAVAIFSETGALLKSFTDSHLASPWGVTIAPADFGPFSNDLLVGNFSYIDSEINAFDPATDIFQGSILINTGSASAGGLWAIGVGNAGSNGSPNDVYFADGINGERDGLFGAITVPEPSTWLQFCAALAGLAGLIARQRRRMLAVRRKTDV